MFWAYDKEEEKVVPKGQAVLTPSEFAKRAKESGFEEEDQEVIFKSSNEDGSEERFEKRVEVFKEKELPVYRHHGWWFVHNCIAHPFIGIFPCKTSFEFHDWTAKKINGK